MRSWIAGVTVAIAMAAPLTVGAEHCDARALLSACATPIPANASFGDLTTKPGAGTQPAVYTGAEAPVLSPAVDTPLAGAADSGVPPAAGPAPDFAWVLALGFLGLIVIRRTRAARAF